MFKNTNLISQLQGRWRRWRHSSKIKSHVAADSRGGTMASLSRWAKNKCKDNTCTRLLLFFLFFKLDYRKMKRGNWIKSVTWSNYLSVGSSLRKGDPPWPWAVKRDGHELSPQTEKRNKEAEIREQHSLSSVRQSCRFFLSFFLQKLPLNGPVGLSHSPGVPNWQKCTTFFSTLTLKKKSFTKAVVESGRTGGLCSTQSCV